MSWKTFPLPQCLAAALLLLAGPLRADPLLRQDEVELIIAQGTTRAAQLHEGAIIAVVDREGFLLALWDVGHHLPDQLTKFDFALPRKVIEQYGLAGGAVTRAMTAAFLSSDQNAFTTRTAGFIIQQHFPPGIRDTGPGPLVGVGFSSLFFSDVNSVKLIPPRFDGSARVDSTVSPGSPLKGRGGVFPLASLNDSPGGVPLYRDGHLVGGVGVTGDGSPTDLDPAAAIFLKQTQTNSTAGFKTGYDLDEEIALAAQTNFRPKSEILASNVLINGIRIPYVYQDPSQIRDVEGTQKFGQLGNAVDIPILLSNPPAAASGTPQTSPHEYPYQRATFGGVDGEIRFPFRDDPLIEVNGRDTVNGAARLTVDDVKTIISDAANRAGQTRAGIRLPIGTKMQVFISVVSNPAKAGEPPEILGVFRTGEATIFSWDVAVQKARTAVFFSNRQLAMSARSVGFLAQRYFPPGLDGRPNGPLFGFQEAVSLRMAPNPRELLVPFPGNPNLPNGITIFPGGFPLYRNGQLVGAVGVSGDGVDQDDIVAASGCASLLAPRNIRADTYSYRGARLPYAKFPRDPEQ